MQIQTTASTTTAEVPMQPASLDIWEKKYQLKSITGEVIDHSIDAMRQRVVDALIAVDTFPNDEAREAWRARFMHALRNGAIPAGRILSNAGAEAHKPKTSTINCTVSGTIPDSMLGILEKATEAGLTLKSGAGIGYEFSTLRPSGAIVAGAGASTSGPLSFMDVFDKVCATVSSAGARRGAQMATFDISHPDVEAFIQAKREDGRLRQFNCSLLITESFLDAVSEDQDWPLVFPVMPAEAKMLKLDDPNQVVWREWPHHDENYIVRDDGLVACKIYRTVRARQLWDTVMKSTYDFAEPGFILIDRVNEMNDWKVLKIPAAQTTRPEHAFVATPPLFRTRMTRSEPPVQTIPSLLEAVNPRCEALLDPLALCVRWPDCFAQRFPSTQSRCSACATRLSLLCKPLNCETKSMINADQTNNPEEAELVVNSERPVGAVCAHPEGLALQKTQSQIRRFTKNHDASDHLILDIRVPVAFFRDTHLAIHPDSHRIQVALRCGSRRLFFDVPLADKSRCTEGSKLQLRDRQARIFDVAKPHVLCVKDARRLVKFLLSYFASFDTNLRTIKSGEWGETSIS